MPIFFYFKCFFVDLIIVTKKSEDKINVVFISTNELFLLFCTQKKRKPENGGNMISDNGIRELFLWMLSINGEAMKQKQQWFISLLYFCSNIDLKYKNKPVTNEFYCFSVALTVSWWV